MEPKLIKIQQIAENLSEHPMLQNIPFDRIVNYAQELIRLVGSPKLFFDKTAIIHIDHHRGELPCDFVSMLQVRGTGCNCGLEYVSTMNTFHGSDSLCDKFVETPTYKIQGGVIITSHEFGDIEISYRSMPIDEDGWPMLPDNTPFLLALEAYIKMRKFTVYFDMGQINQAVFAQAQQEYAWRVGQAQTSLIKPSIDEMETLTNMWNTLIPRVREHRSNFSVAHNKEYLRQH